MSKGIEDFADTFMTYIEKLLGKAVGGDPMAILELLVGPLGMLVMYLGKKLVEFLAKIDWNAVGKSVISALTDIFNIVQNSLGSMWSGIKDVIDFIGTSIFGIQTWTQIKAGIKFIQSLFTPEGLWKQIEAAINWIGTTVFGETTWTNMKNALDNLIDMIFEIGNGMVSAWNTVLGFWLGNKGFAVPRPTSNVNPFPNFGSGGDSGGGGGFPTTMVAGGQIYNVNPETGGLIAGAIGTAAGDFISRPGGGMMPFSPDDTIIGVKDTGKLGGNNITNNLYVSAGVDKKEFKKLLTEFSRQQGRELRTRTSYYGG